MTGATLQNIALKKFPIGEGAMRKQPELDDFKFNPESQQASAASPRIALTVEDKKPGARPQGPRR